MALYLVFGVAAVIVAALVYAPIRRRRQRRALAERPFPRQWRRLLRDRWVLYRYLPSNVRFALQRQLQVMMSATDFYGCNGLQVTEEMKLLTLAQAALLYQNASQDQLADFPHVLLYPNAFVREGDTTDELGLVSRQRHVLLGESWQQGRVILSWSDIVQDLRRLDGHSLVIHEYAHQIDGYDGAMNGSPLLPNETVYRRWTKIMQAAYEDLCREAEWGQPDIDPYATSNPAEFFAVISE
ncbi:zinc-dependent peptidase [Marinimicrobium sp. ABcell2]|uniref:M90 family metallopeptidase n=1 Tax=Marinimicrobium sp. ABcell2 TaxID=3069751 RepID=UPI0027B28C3D|nr:M90 family metallopeptidase [Marinimicrobium sp. ABcell2]MDQ2076412.1 zinc-dependent peptidase [Marinimicrobium sp. ABcell2]